MSGAHGDPGGGPDDDPDDQLAADRDVALAAEKAAFRQLVATTLQRELDEAAARERAWQERRERPNRRQRGTSGVSCVFTVRLDNDAFAALEARAEVIGVRPSVLARNFIRMGLTRTDPTFDDALDRLDDAVAALRAVTLRRSAQ